MRDGLVCAHVQSIVRDIGAGHTDGVYSLAVSPDGQYVFSGSGDKTIKQWDVSSGSEVRSLSGECVVSVVCECEWPCCLGVDCGLWFVSVGVVCVIGVAMCVRACVCVCVRMCVGVCVCV